jgi:predicted transcriptional regulator
MEQKTKPPMMDEAHQIIKYHIEHVDEISEQAEKFLDSLPKERYTYVEILQALITSVYHHAIVKNTQNAVQVTLP